jgi:hypothetical protein
MASIQNIALDLFRSVTNTLKLLVAQEERALSIGNIFGLIQKKLDGDQPGDGEEIYQPTGYVLDVYSDNDGLFAIITKNDGKLYKLPVKVDEKSNLIMGTEQEVTMDFAPATRQMAIKRQADGKVRWFAFPACTAVLNRSGEIDSRALFDSFVEHVDRTGDYPELDFFHAGESIVLGKADWVGRDDSAYCASGIFYDTPEALAAIRSIEENGNYWGLSIAYIPIQEPDVLRSEEGIAIPVFNKGINRFISLLPEKTAASILTAISIEGVERMNKKIEEALKKLTGDDAELYDALSKKLNSVNREAADMISREGATPAADEKPATEPIAQRAITEEDMTALVGSDLFKNAVREVVSAFISEQQNAVEEKAKDDKPAEPVKENARVDDELMEAISDLQAAVADLSKSREMEVQEVLNDLPARIANKTIVRPRASRMPGAKGTGVGKESLADIANRTLTGMGETA